MNGRERLLAARAHARRLERRSTASSTFAASARTTIDWAALGNPDGATPTCCRISASSSTTSRGANAMARRRRPALGFGHRARSIDADRSADRRSASELGIPRNDDFNGADAGGRRLLPADDATRLALLRPQPPTCRPVRARQPRRARPTRTRDADRRSTAGARTGVVYRRGGRGSLGDARDAKSSSAPARCNRRSSCSSPASGRRTLLRRVRHPVSFIALAGVGENLQDHLQARVIFRCTKPITTNDALLNMAAASSAIGLAIRPASSDRPDGGRHQPRRHLRAHAIAALASTRRPVPRRDAVVRHGGLARCTNSPGSRCPVCQLRPESRGHVRIGSRAIRCAAPAMQPNYLSTDTRSRDARRRHPPRAHARRDACARRRIVAGEYRPGPAASDRRRSARVREEHRRHHLPSERHRQDGPGVRSDSPSSTPSFAFTASTRPSRRRLQRHADARVRQHQRAGGDDRREGRRHDSCGG